MRLADAKMEDMDKNEQVGKRERKRERDRGKGRKRVRVGSGRGWLEEGEKES